VVGGCHSEGKCVGGLVLVFVGIREVSVLLIEYHKGTLHNTGVFGGVFTHGKIRMRRHITTLAIKDRVLPIKSSSQVAQHKRHTHEHPASFKRSNMSYQISDLRCRHPSHRPGHNSALRPPSSSPWHRSAPLEDVTSER
jgi:hypothetical protein